MHHKHISLLCVCDSQTQKEFWECSIYGKLEDVFRLTGAKCCVDSAFGNMNREYLYKLSQDLFLFGSLALTRQEKKLDLRKKAGNIGATEWGMRMIQTSFPRIMDQFVYKERGEWRICLRMIVLMYNMHARMVGIIQIQNMCMNHL